VPLESKVISRNAAGNVVLNHIVAAATYTAAPVAVTDGFFIHAEGGRGYDALEATYSFLGGDGTTMATVRPWFFVPQHDPAGAGGTWLSAPTMEQIPLGTAGTDIMAPVRRINGKPVAATRMYLQVVAIAGTAPTNLYMVAYGISGTVADVSLTDIEVDIEPGSAVIIRDSVTTDEARVTPANEVHDVDEHVLLVQPLDAEGNAVDSGTIVDSAATLDSMKVLLQEIIIRLDRISS
jgi:hypothetical protein